MKSWIVGLIFSAIIVAMGNVVHTPLQTASFFFSIPLLPALFLFTAVAAKLGMGNDAIAVGMELSLVFFGSFFYGMLIFLALRFKKWRERNKSA